MQKVMGRIKLRLYANHGNCRSLRANGGIQMTLPHVKSAIRFEPSDTEEQSEQKWNEFLRYNPKFVSVSPDIIPDWYVEHKRKYGWKPMKRTKQEKEKIGRAHV